MSEFFGKKKKHLIREDNRRDGSFTKNRRRLGNDKWEKEEEKLAREKEKCEDIFSLTLFLLDFSLIHPATPVPPSLGGQWSLAD